VASLIKVLPVEVANRIAAGEVVERPASVVKELLENALDAGARNLNLDLEEGGVRLVRLSDDGVGMSRDDLALCTLSHATSKIGSVDDLFRVASFGFRGEALPSIASVSETTVLSRQKNDEIGARLVCRGGEFEEPVPAGGPVGTTVEVRNLFFNVPARRKFLKRTRTELSHCLEAVTRLLLPEPGVSIRITHDGRRVLEVGPDENLRDRVRTFFGKKLAEPLLETEGREGDLALEALIGPPSEVRTTSRHQYLYLNGRFVRDRSLSFAVRDAYRGLVMPKDQPVFFLHLSMDPSGVDVNVHPTKTEVRFRDKDRVFSLVRSTVRRCIIDVAGDRPLRFKEQQTGAGSAGSSAPASPPTRQQLLSDLEKELDAPAAVPAALPPMADFSSQVAEMAADRGLVGAGNPCRGHGAVRPVPETELDAGVSGRFVQVHRSYIVLESPEGLRIVDQHALHERRIYEDLLRRFDSSDGEDQRLLVPEVVDLGAADQALLLSKVEDLRPLGLEIEPFGGTSVCVHAVPMVLSRISPADLVQDLIEVLREDAARLRAEDLVKETVAGLACRAAVKFNDPLSSDEIEDLLRWSRENPEARNCPHGRPVAVSVTLRELENQFQRKK